MRRPVRDRLTGESKDSSFGDEMRAPDEEACDKGCWWSSPPVRARARDIRQVSARVPPACRIGSSKERPPEEHGPVAYFEKKVHG